MNFIRTDSSNNHFQQLVVLLDAHLKVTDGDAHDFYNQFNKITHIRHVIVAFIDEQPVGCGAFKEYSTDSVEIKRMFVMPEHRGQRIANKILDQLEEWAGELKFTYCILETGKNQPEAIRLYERTGYHRIPNYGQYEKIENSVCMKKAVSKQ